LLFLTSAEFFLVSDQNTYFVLGYLGVSLLCSTAVVASSDDRLWRAAWWIIFVVIVALGLDRVVGLTEAFADRLRDRARYGNWYESRQGLQIAVSVAAVVVAVAVMALMVGLRNRLSLTMMIAVSGAALLVSLRIIKNVSLHNVDRALRTEIVQVRASTLVETLLLLTVAAIAIVVAMAPIRDRIQNR
jgi:hypothetical protein